MDVYMYLYECSSTAIVIQHDFAFKTYLQRRKADNNRVTLPS